MANRIGRRRLFGLVGAVAALVAVPPTVTAATLPPLPDSAYPPNTQPLPVWPEIGRADAGLLEAVGINEYAMGTYSGNSRVGGVDVVQGLQVGGGGIASGGVIFPTQITTNVRNGEILVSISADTTEFVSALDEMEARVARAAAGIDANAVLRVARSYGITPSQVMELPSSVFGSLAAEGRALAF